MKYRRSLVQPADVAAVDHRAVCHTFNPVDYSQKLYHRPTQRRLKALNQRAKRQGMTARSLSRSSPEVVSKLLGDADVSLTPDIYARVQKERAQRVAEGMEK